MNQNRKKRHFFNQQKFNQLLQNIFLTKMFKVYTASFIDLSFYLYVDLFCFVFAVDLI